MARGRKTAAAVVAVAAAGLAWSGRGWLIHMWVAWRESKETNVREVQAK
jgi:hypothetical protein